MQEPEKIIVTTRNPGSLKLAEARKRYRAAAIALHGSKCCKCGFSDIRALQFDHVNAGGHTHIKNESTRPSYYKQIICAEVGRFQLLCANCNWIKRHENKEIGHLSEINSQVMKKYWADVKSGKRIGPTKNRRKASPLSESQKTVLRACGLGIRGNGYIPPVQLPNPS